MIHIPSKRSSFPIMVSIFHGQHLLAYGEAWESKLLDPWPCICGLTISVMRVPDGRILSCDILSTFNASYRWV
jgi:hypothetical protein